ncbi:hypothetical protein B0A48_08509 [Cryoendolithus antarcticus]|uniref:DNA helicase n=1 Tax=Cryoendolithus antarcticus TaxID=1507870 RepID=A0A1V8T6C1_9PEZI|nr:hypothetical protein B0A48_08509 [Cryoendolithus antarcticus]
MPPTPLDPSLFATHQLTLLTHEHETSLAQTTTLTSTLSPKVLQTRGLALLNLTLLNTRTGLGGKTVLELGPDPALTSKDEDGTAGLGEHGIRVGDLCGVVAQPRGGERKAEKKEAEGKGVRGVVTRVRRGEIWVALDAEREGKDDERVPGEGGERVWLLKLDNSAPHNRLTHTMTLLSSLPSSQRTPLVDVLLGSSSPSPVPPALTDPSPSPLLEPLNPSQRQAVYHALSSREISIIHGPPGTGKTQTLIVLIQLLLQENQRVLVCGPSNISVDNLVERLGSALKEDNKKVPMIRLGHPARLLRGVLNYSLEVLSRSSDAADILSDVRSELDAKTKSLSKTRSGRERKAVYAELKILRKEFREREKRVVGDLVKEAKVVFSTLHGAGGSALAHEAFDVLVIDEAAQALEAQCWVPVLIVGKTKGGVGRMVLAGDDKQLGPTIMSTGSGGSKKEGVKKDKKGKENGTAIKAEALATNGATEVLESLTVTDTKDNKLPSLETTLFTRLLALHGPSIKTLLNIQYRMHANISAFPSAALYNNELRPHPSVASRLLTELPYEVAETEDTIAPLVFLDTQGGDFPESREDDDASATARGKFRGMLAESKLNPNEAALVAAHVARLVDAGVKEEGIGVVTPYNAQLGVLAGLLKERFPEVELGSVDGFQGREKEAIVLSLVRSNAEGEVGFLGEERRLNVAMTRPKRHLCVVGDSETVSRGSKFLMAWMEFLEEKADLRYPDLSILDQ